jgi:predicted RNase H-like nuclease (RuvC/YqgF family)
MASLIRTRILPRVVKLAPIVCQRSLSVRQMMTMVPKASGNGADRIDDILNVIVSQRKEMDKLRQEIEDLEQKNEDLQARVDECQEEIQGSSGIDRDTLEEKLNALEEKLDEAKDIVDEIRGCLE